MIKLVSFKFFIVILATILFSGCLKDKMTKTYTIIRPVFANKSGVLANIKSNAPQLLKSPGKIYILGNYIFLNEVNKGVHVIDNSNSSNPRAVAFIDIPGNIDIAVKGNTMYADFYTDMLAIDISDPLHASLTKLVPNVFPERSYGNGFIYDSTKVIIDWIKKDTTIDTGLESISPWRGCPNCAVFLASDNAQKSGTYVPGIGGSMARFAIVNNYLYTVNLYNLGVHDVSNSADPVVVGTSSIGANIETIYPFRDKLFIGSRTGMFIYNIANPATPEREGSFNHARACDPVVADDNYAFVTLRTGTVCEGTQNELDVIDVRYAYPSLVKTYPLRNPHGLAKDGDLLFVCDGNDGLKLFNAKNVEDLKLMKHFRGMEAYDVIAWNKKLLLVASNGLYQFDYSNPQNIQLRSTIAISR